MKTVIALVLIGIVVSLGQALFAMTSGPDQSGRVVKALTVRIGLSLALFIALMIGWKLGLIEPLGAR